MNNGVERAFWHNRKVFVTGHTGFKGSWLTLWLTQLGAQVCGYSLAPPTSPSMFELVRVGDGITSNIADIREKKKLEDAMQSFSPEIVFHLAAQPLVRYSYQAPVETYETNVMGTVNLFEAIRNCSSVRAVVIITTDKCYENHEWVWGYRENDRLGGYDPYSNSKACAELVVQAYRNSFFNLENYLKHQVAIASARAGNVIGGGDWAADRLVPDCVKALLNGDKIFIRSPQAIRPWQHVLEPLSGYIILAQNLFSRPEFSGGWNFGPEDNDAKNVDWVVNRLCQIWGSPGSYERSAGNHPHEATYLKLDISKAKGLLGWSPKWNIDDALKKVVEWTKAYEKGADLKNISLQQISEYQSRCLEG